MDFSILQKPSLMDKTRTIGQKWLANEQTHSRKPFLRVQRVSKRGHLTKTDGGGGSHYKKDFNNILFEKCVNKVIYFLYSVYKILEPFKEHLKYLKRIILSEHCSC